MKLISLLALIASFSLQCLAQDSTLTISAPVDIPRLGWDKVMLMSNGNTLLFHFQPRKGIIVKTFDKDRKEISSLKHICNVLDINVLDRTEIKGFHEINNEAVLFLSQFIENRETLIRLRFSADNGKLLKEEIIIQSPSFQNKVSTYIVRDDAHEGYSIFCYKQLELLPKEQLKLMTYNNEHKLIKEIPIPDLGMDSIHYAHFVSANMDVNGSICVTLQLSKIVYYPDVLDKYLVTCYLPKGAEEFIVLRTKLDQAMDSYYANYTFNPFSNSLNILLTTLQTAVLKDGLKPVTEQLFVPYMLMYDQADFNNFQSKAVANMRANNYRKQLTGTINEFKPAAIRSFTNTNGVTTIISEEHKVHAYYKGLPSKYTCLGNIGITQLNEQGEEIWGTVLPKVHYIDYSMLPREHAYRHCAKKLFQGEHDKTYEEQFSGFDCHTANKNFFIVYNDLKANFDKKISVPLDTLYTYQNAHAMYHKMGRKKELSKNYLLGTPVENESRSAMIESADFDEKTGTYTTLFVYRKDEKYSVHIAWKKLD